MSVEDILGKIAEFEVKHAYGIVAAAVIITVVMAFGALQIQIQTDMTTSLIPQNLEVVKLLNKVSDKFGENDMVMIVVQLDSSDDENAVKDVRDVRVLKMLEDLGKKISKENQIVSVFSAANVFEQTGGVPGDQKTVDLILKNIPESQMPFNKDYSVTLMYAGGDIKSEKSIKSVVNEINDDVKKTNIPPGVKVSVTGMPVLRTTLMSLLLSDMLKSLSAAAVIILLLLLAIYRSISKGLLPYIPLMLALVWAVGTMGYMGIPLSLFTVAIAPMVLGIGIEFGVFVVNRYFEEIQKGIPREYAIKKGVSGVGRAIFGSTGALTIGFLSMLVSTMMHDMGITLAMGIIYAMIAAVFVNPAFIIAEDDLKIYLERRVAHTLDKNIVMEMEEEITNKK